MTLGKGLLPDPFPPTGPDQGTLATWASELDDADQQLTAAGNRLLQAAVDPQAWYGQAADNFRAEAAKLGYALIGLGTGMTAVSQALTTYELAGETWDQDLASGKRLDASGVAHDNEVATRYQQAYAQWRASQIPTAPTPSAGAAPGQPGSSPSSSSPQPSSSPSAQPTNPGGGPLTNDEVTDEVLPQVWSQVAAFAEQSSPPLELHEYDSPQKSQAVRTVQEAEQTLVLAGLLAASRVDTVVGEMTTSVGPGGKVSHNADPLAGLTALGVTEVSDGHDEIDQPTHQTPMEIKLEQENGLLPPQLDPVLAANDVRGGALALAEHLWGDDGTAGARDAAAAGRSATSDIAAGRVPGAYGTAEGDDLTGDGSGDDLEISQIGVVGRNAVSVLGIASDLQTLADTPDHGAHNEITRTSAVLNATAAGVDVEVATAGAVFGSTVEIPGVDLVTGTIFLATGAYALINHAVSGDPPPPHTDLP